MPKRLTAAQILGQQGVNLIEQRVLEMGCAWHPTNQSVEVGIDGHIELRDGATGEMTGSMLFVQSKARSDLERETNASFEFTCTKDDLQYWLNGTAPVLLVVSKPRTKEAWWVSIKDYFRVVERRKSRRIFFDKQKSRFDKSAVSVLIAQARAAGSGAYFRPPPKYEVLISNLLPVTRLPPKLYRAATPFRSREDLTYELKKRVTWPETEFVLTEDAIISVHDLRNDPWPATCDAGSVETFDIEEWRDSEDSETRRQFTQVLNRSLGRRVAPMGIHYLKDDEILYFKASKPVEGSEVLPSRRKWYRSRRFNTSREVFGPRFSKAVPGRVSYYRHVGFERHFRRIGGKWFLEINPTYHYTTDGHEPHPFREEYLSKIKSIEGNNAVAGSVVMFAALLQDEISLFREPYPFLGFGSLERLQVPVGIEDSAWLKRDETQPPPTSDEPELESKKEEAPELALFADES